MKILKPIQIEEFLNILDKKPKQHIAHFSESSHLLTKKLQQFCQDIDSKYHLYCTKDVFYEKSKTKYVHAPHIHIFKFDLHRPSYALQKIKYDYIISTLDFEKESKNEFLEKCHPILCKGGNMIIITPHSNDVVLEVWQSSLKKYHYVPTDIIDTLFDDYTVIVAKKMSEEGKK